MVIMIHLITRNLFLILLLLDCYWVARDWFNRHSFCECSFVWSHLHSLGEQPALKCGFYVGFQGVWSLWCFKEQLYRKKFCLHFLTYITFLDSSLVTAGLQEEHDLSDTLQTGSLVGDCKREEACIFSLLQFRSYLEDPRDHYDML